MTGPEVRQIFKIKTVWKLDIFLPKARLLTPLKVEKEIKNQKKFQDFFVAVYLLLTPKLCPGSLSYENS